MIVSKFGGSSVKDAVAMKRCADIVLNNLDIKVVILSATYNTTNNLELCAKLCLENKLDDALKNMQSMKERHYQIADELGVSSDNKKIIDDLVLEGESLLRGMAMLKECSDRAMDRLYSIGERTSSALFAAVLKTLNVRKIAFLDAREIIKTDSAFKKAKPNLEKIKVAVNEKLMPLLNEGYLVVTQGFIGSNDAGVTTTLGREGSDFSAALISEAIDAKACHIYTDVAGIYSADPRFVKDARKLDELSYFEASTMARLGAKVLFPETMAPVSRKNIPIYVGSSLKPEVEGTWIYPEVKTDRLLTSVAKSKNHTFIKLKNLNLDQFVFNKRILDIMAIRDQKYDVLRFANNEASIIASGDLNEFIDELKTLGTVETVPHLARVSAIGHFKLDTSILPKVLGAVEKADIKIELSDFKESYLSFFVSEDRGDDLVSILHNN